MQYRTFRIAWIVLGCISALTAMAQEPGVVEPTKILDRPALTYNAADRAIILARVAVYGKKQLHACRGRQKQSESGQKSARKLSL